MLQVNGTFTGQILWTVEDASFYALAGVAKPWMLLCCVVAGLCLPVPLWLHKSYRAVILTTLFVCRKEIVGTIYSAATTTDFLCPVIVIAIQYAIASAHESSGAPVSGKSKAPTPLFSARILPCHTTHTRFFPSRHSFGYAYLLVGIPIGWRHEAGLLTCDPEPSSPKRSWFSVHNEDYLARGSHVGGLRAKLDEYLQQQSVDPSLYPHAYLITAPRFLGWSFNPVSFWYLYDMKQTLKAMILEVNNTFDERRMYLLQQAASESGSKFRNSWKKDFHVSPFNDREGGYLLVAIDPFARIKSSSDGTAASIDNTITLSSPAPDTKAKLVARVNSIAPPIDPTRLSSIEKAKFMLRWCWSGFLTNPRILVEARVLWTKKKLQLFYRPEVNTGSIGRQESQEEVILERAFRHWLTAVAEESNITVAYTSAAGVQRGHRHALPGNRRLPLTLGPDEADFDLEVLTPEWYAELARARDLRETFARRYSAAQSGDRMVIVNNYGQTILKGGLDRAIERRRTRTNSSVQETMRRAAADHLRSGKNLLSCIIATFVQPLIRPVESTGDSCLTLSDFMDLTEVDGRHEIEWAAIIVLLADRLALGFTGLLKWYAKLSWYGLIFIVVHQLKRVIVA